MTLEIKQTLKLTQQLVMTPQLQLAIKLLQLSRLELLTAINQELETNPVLEEALGDEEPELSAWHEEEEAEVVSSPEEREAPLELGAEINWREEFDWEAYLEDKAPPPVRQEREEVETPNYENLMAAVPNLRSQLTWQLQLADLTEREKLIGTLIIGNLDEDGYLQASCEELAAELQISPGEVEEVLKKVQELEPPGIAARDLAECLLLQVQARGITNPHVRPIIEKHLKNLENRNYNAIAKSLRISPEEVAEAVAIISQLDPKPGRCFDSLEARYISPDIYVYKMGDDYVVSLNEDGLPKLRISSYYREVLRGGSLLPEETKNYIQRRLKSAVWFIKSIHQRRNTIYRVAKSIVDYQRDFLDHGITHLKPLTLKQIADAVGLHESTVSRVTSNKYMHTPQGVFELKFFFNSGIARLEGDQVASESVKEKIRQIVLSEDPDKPYSDQDIVRLLEKQHNIVIARRTVAKYREALGLLSSSKRRRALPARPKAAAR